jgi:hypothetical protein
MQNQSSEWTHVRGFTFVKPKESVLKMPPTQKDLFTEIESRTQWKIVPGGYTITCFGESRDPHLPQDCEARASHLQAQRDHLDLGLRGGKKFLVPAISHTPLFMLIQICQTIKDRHVSETLIVNFLKYNYRIR